MSEKFADLRVRLLSAIIMIICSVTVFLLGGYFVLAYLIVGICLMLWEYRNLYRSEGERINIDIGIMCISGIGALVVTSLYGFSWSITPLVIASVALFRSNIRYWLWLAGGLVYIGLSMSAFLTIFQTTQLGLFYVFWIILIVSLSDIGGYFAGRIIGGKKLWPKVSPKKTWSGTIGGWSLALLAGVFLGIFGPVPIISSVIVSLLLAIAAQSGDLLESWIKRQHNIKDASAIIPGHGGILDRLDGFLAAVIVFFLIYGWL